MRIRVTDVLDMLVSGLSREDVLDELPDLEPEDVDAALRFASKLLDGAASATAIASIRRGLQGMYEGTGEDAEDAFASLERKFGIAEQA